MNIVQLIKSEIEDYESSYIEIVPGFIFNQKEIIEEIYRLYNSKYKSGEFDSEGFRKYFYNIVRSSCDVSTKLVDFDIKDILFTTEPGQDNFKVWLLERKFHYWAKKNNFGLVLNRIFYELPIFGSVVLKKVADKWEFVDLRNFYVDQAADSLDKAEYIIEKHIYTISEFIRKAKQYKWDYVQEVLETNTEPFVELWERYGFVQDDNGDWKYTRSVIYTYTKLDELTKEEINDGYVLEQTEVDNHPYFEFHWEKIPGRWLGKGRVELLRDNQKRVNELINLKVKASYWSSLQIFQTQDETFSRNLLTSVRNGEVLQTRTGIRPINNVERNTSSLIGEQSLWLNNRDELTSSYDVLRGERTPSGVPLGVTQITATMGSSYFEQIRENIALRVKEWLYNYILPEFKKDLNEDNLLILIGKDFEKVRDQIKDLLYWQKIQDFVRKNKAFPTPIQEEAIKLGIEAEIQKKNEITLTFPEGYFDDVESYIEIVITGESVDTRAKMISYQWILQMINNNPQVFENPLTREILFRMMELAGISPEEIKIPETTQVPTSTGGSLAKPVIPSNLVLTPEEKTI